MPAMDLGRAAPTRRSFVLLAGAIIVVAVLAAYRNSLGGALVFDDFLSIRDNPSIRHLWPLSSALSPPAGARTVSGRPILNLSFALNYALGGTDVRGYHAVNVAIHALAALFLFGITRRTLERTIQAGGASPASAERFGGEAVLVAFAAALLWAVHPLQTESVTYLVQRAEALMGLFYLCSLYAFIRGAEVPTEAGSQAASRRWFALSVVSCLLGAGTKEVIVSAPLVFLLYDRTFIAGSFRGAWRRRRGVYLALSLSWIELTYLVAGNHDRGGTAGMDMGSKAFWDYWPTQGPAIVRYLKLAVWPVSQQIDYGFETRWFEQPLSGVPADLAVLGLLALTAIGIWRRPALGFLGACFFAVLAPTSLIPGMRQTVVEHRMYLALAPFLILLVLALERGLNRLAGRGRTAAWLTLGATLAASAAAAVLSARRNEVYRSDRSVWADVVAKQPDSVTGLNNLGNDLFQAGRLQEAKECYQRAVRAEPAYLRGYINLGHSLEALGRNQEAMDQYRTALRLRPDYPEGHANLGRVLATLGRGAESVAEFERALQLKPGDAETHNNLGAEFLVLGRFADAQAQFGEAVVLNPDYAEAEGNLGLALYRGGRPADAVGALERALRLGSDQPSAHFTLGLALQASGRMAEAAAEFQEVARREPGSAEARNNLGSALALLGRISAAQAQFAEAVKLKPDYAEAHRNLGQALEETGRLPEAIAEFREALKLKPDFAAAREDLAAALKAGPTRN
jgi:tetratricopeptide (TPR) repeat protein